MFDAGFSVFDAGLSAGLCLMQDSVAGFSVQDSLCRIVLQDCV